MKTKLNIKELKKEQLEMDLDAAEIHNLNMDGRTWFENRITAIVGELYETLAVVETFKDWKIKKGKIDEDRFISTINFMFEDEIRNDERKYDLLENTDGLLVDSSRKYTLDNFELLTTKKALHLTLVEECSDVLHFTLTLLNLTHAFVEIDFELLQGEPTKLFKTSIRRILELEDSYILNNLQTSAQVKRQMTLCFVAIMSYFNSLGITDDELEHAYYEKHKINQERLESGY